MRKKIKEAEKKYKKAAKDLIKIVEETYPIGSIIQVKIGNHYLEIEITGHSDAWWHRPGEIYGINIKTEKIRRFDVSAILD